MKLVINNHANREESTCVLLNFSTINNTNMAMTRNSEAGGILMSLIPLSKLC